MSWELAPYKLAAIRWYVLEAEALAISLSSTRIEGQPIDKKFDQVTAVFRQMLGEMNRLRNLSGENIDCAIGTVPCDGLCLPDCPPRPTSSGSSSSSTT